MFVLALIVLPVLLRTAEELSSRTLAELIEGEDDDERPSLGRRLAYEGAIGSVAAVVTGTVAFGLAMVAPGTDSVVAWPFATVTAAATLITVLSGGLLGHAAVKRSKTGRRVSGTRLALTAMAIGAAVYLALAFAAGVLWVATILAEIG